jgi:sulfide dehydrogenase cytochrome subunit
MLATRIAIAAAMVAMACTGTHAASPEPPPGASSCSGCHPANAGVEAAMPRLAGRNAAELVAQMQAFRAGQLQPTVMDQIAKGFTDEEIRAIAAWYAQQR